MDHHGHVEDEAEDEEDALGTCCILLEVVLLLLVGQSNSAIHLVSSDEDPRSEVKHERHR